MRAAIEQVLTDRRLAKTRPAFFEGAIEHAAKQYEGSPSAELLIIETPETPDAIFQQIEQLSRVCRPETNLILIGRHNDVALYRNLTRQGIREYLPVPVDPNHLLESVVAVCADPEDMKQGRLISFIASSGGAGSTTMANNVAWSLGKLYDNEATLVDLDLAFGSVAIDFNLELPENAAQALAQADRLDDQLLARIIGKYNDNLGVLTSPGECARAADIDPAALEEMLRRLRHNASWVAVDLPHYWGEWVRHALDLSDEIVLTAVPTLASLRNAKALYDTMSAKRKNDAPVRVVLNRVGQNPENRDIGQGLRQHLGSCFGGDRAARAGYIRSSGEYRPHGRRGRQGQDRHRPDQRAHDDGERAPRRGEARQGGEEGGPARQAAAILRRRQDRGPGKGLDKHVRKARFDHPPPRQAGRRAGPGGGTRRRGQARAGRRARRQVSAAARRHPLQRDQGRGLQRAPRRRRSQGTVEARARGGARGAHRHHLARSSTSSASC